MAPCAARRVAGLTRASRIVTAAARVQTRRSYVTEVVGVIPQHRLVRGAANEPLYFVNDAGAKISPWHDIPLRRREEPNVFNFVCEIPRDTRPKYEINTEAEFNPIIQVRRLGGLDADQKSESWPLCRTRPRLAFLVTTSSIRS